MRWRSDRTTSLTPAATLRTWLMPSTLHAAAHRPDLADLRVQLADAALELVEPVAHRPFRRVEGVGQAGVMGGQLLVALVHASEDGLSGRFEVTERLGRAGRQGLDDRR